MKRNMCTVERFVCVPRKRGTLTGIGSHGPSIRLRRAEPMEVEAKTLW